MNTLIDLIGKHVLVIGASSGIGKQTAITLSRIGAKLTLVARTEDKLKTTLHELEGEGHAYCVADISELSGIEEMVKQTIQKNGSLDGMVYAAGISMSMPLQMFKPEKLQSLFDVNFFAFVESVRQVTKKGRYNPGMRIVGISSIASLKGDKTHLGYSASKAAMDAAVRCIAKEVAEKDICINTVAPGMTATGMLSRFADNIGSDSESMKELKSRQYLGVIQPEAVAETIAFLMSPAAEYITGITLPIDGGMTTC